MTTAIDKPLPPEASGMDRLVDKYRRQFRIPENYEHYSEDDYQSAERQYLRFCLMRGGCSGRGLDTAGSAAGLKTLMGSVSAPPIRKDASRFKSIGESLGHLQ